LGDDRLDARLGIAIRAHFSGELRPVA
jgi:hypothetical protein